MNVENKSICVINLYFCRPFSCIYIFYVMGIQTQEFFGKWIGMAHHRMFHLLTRTFQKEGFDLTFEQFILLKIINANEGISQQELANFMDRDKTSITRAINILEDNHKVIRINLKDDRRKKGIYLTKEGRILLEKILPKFLEIKSELEKGFNKKEISNTVDLLKRLVNRVNEMEEKL